MRATHLEVFTTPEAATEFATEVDGQAADVRRVAGRQLLDAIDQVDVVTVDQRVDVAISRAGARYLQAAEQSSDDSETSAHSKLLEALRLQIGS